MSPDVGLSVLRRFLNPKSQRYLYSYKLVVNAFQVNYEASKKLKPSFEDRSRFKEMLVNLQSG